MRLRLCLASQIAVRAVDRKAANPVYELLRSALRQKLSKSLKICRNCGNIMCNGSFAQIYAELQIAIRQSPYRFSVTIINYLGKVLSAVKLFVGLVALALLKKVIAHFRPKSSQNNNFRGAKSFCVCGNEIIKGKRKLLLFVQRQSSTRKWRTIRSQKN